ncbi:hypothetical protein PRZ48_005258 [Zasmidium cellare]|uniref:Uncharacterized protein n=1 Tax=Zasmidium cellare TaxID=395010 RepID=A0ABR0ES47_ZASCE|nr:hypothetical protein PRZ48_005258 [Zasmidium cellare]
MSLPPDSEDLQHLAEHLALTFFDFPLFDGVRVSYKPLHNEASTIAQLPDGKVAMFINDRPLLLTGLSHTTALISLLLRELCVAFIILETGGTIGGFSIRRRWWDLGETGYGLGWLDLAGNAHERASKLLGINDLNLELRRKVRTEYIRSGLEPSRQQIDRFFGGEDPLMSDSGEGRIECRKNQLCVGCFCFVVLSEPLS